MAELTIYIDEAGDPGVRDGLKYLGDRYEWFTFGAIAVRSSREAQLPDWVRGLREEANSRQAGALHYANITRTRRQAVCSALAKRPCRGFVFASHKSNLRQYFNPRIGEMLSGEKVYNWCFRLLLERVTAWAERWQKQQGSEKQKLKIVIAERGHNFDRFNTYIDKLRWQRESGTLFLKGPGLSREHLDRSLWSVERCEQVAGLQLADLLASAFYQAANTASPAHDLAPALALRPIIQGGHDAANSGVTLWPLAHQGAIPIDARKIFEAYGYGF